MLRLAPLIVFLSSCSTLANFNNTQNGLDDIERENAVRHRAKAEADRVAAFHQEQAEEKTEKQEIYDQNNKWTKLSKEQIFDLARNNNIEPIRIIKSDSHVLFMGVYLDSIKTSENQYGRDMTSGVIIYTPEPDIEKIDHKLLAMAGLAATARNGMYISIDCSSGWSYTPAGFSPIRKYSNIGNQVTDEYKIASVICSYKNSHSPQPREALINLNPRD